MSAICTAPIPFATLVDYWFGELGEREAAVEEHFFGCAHCSRRLQALADLGIAIRDGFRNGAFPAVVSAPLVEAMKRERVRVREYRLSPGETVDCTITASDDLVVSHLRAPLAGVRRLDLFRTSDVGDALHLEDIPFDASSGEVLVVPYVAALRKMPDHVLRMRLVAVDEHGERTIGDYTFNHTADIRNAG